MTQAELARRARVSPSYLNLIEANKRPVAGVLLDRIARGLGIERSLLDGEAERRLAENLAEVAADPVLAGSGRMPQGAEHLVGREPAWAELILDLYRAYQDQSRAVMALADRLNRDPFLGENIHRVLTHVTAIRAAAEILEGEARLGRAERGRFLSIVASDSRRLSESAQALIAYFDNAQMRVRSATPMEHVDALVSDENNHFPELEDAAAGFIASLRGGETPEDGARRVFRDDGKTENAGDPRSHRFRLIAALGPLVAAREVATILSRHAAFSADASRALAVPALHSYLAGAILMPYQPFLEAAEACRYDVDVLSVRFGVSYEQAAHRLATLRRPGAEGVHFAFMRSDPSGYVTKRLPLPGLPLPRYGTACPLWPVYGAFQTPGTTLRQFGAVPTGESFLFFARAVDKSPPAVGMPRRLLSIMLACSTAEAQRVCYGDGLERSTATVPVGTVCRLCPRPDCAYRQEEPVIARS